MNVHLKSILENISRAKQTIMVGGKGSMDTDLFKDLTDLELRTLSIMKRIAENQPPKELVLGFPKPTSPDTPDVGKLKKAAEKVASMITGKGSGNDGYV